MFARRTTATLAVAASLSLGLAASPSALADIKPYGARLSLARYGTTTPVRTLNVTVYLADVNRMTEDDVTDTHFRKVRGLADPGCVSFESVKRPGRFLRGHGPDRPIELSDGLFDPWFAGDATFCARRAADTPSWSGAERFESVKFPGYYLRVSGDQLILSNVQQDNLFVEMAPVSLGWPIQWGDWITSNGTTTITRWGACTGLTAPWESRRTSVIAVTLTTGRIVAAAAASTSYMGFYPRVILTGADDSLGDVYAIKREIWPCVW